MAVLGPGVVEVITGTVKWFNVTKGYGFIIPDDDDKDLFVHKSEVNGGFLEDGQKVEYEVSEGEKGSCANNVSPV